MPDTVSPVSDIPRSCQRPAEDELIRVFVVADVAEKVSEFAGRSVVVTNNNDYWNQRGELVTSGGIGSLPRNKGQMPWTFYLDTNLQRAFKITHNAKAEHPQTLTVNLRSSNVLNHENVTAVGSVLGSPNFGIPYAADNGRRVEAGVRYSF